MMTRKQFVNAVSEAISDEMVVPVMSAVKDWEQLPERFWWVACMGYGSSCGLGMALAQPKRRVLVLDGDGSLLMNLGTLVTIAGVSPPNLVHFVLENGTYELPGDVQLPGQGQFSLAGFARAAGLKKVYEIDALEALEERLPAILQEQGPIFVSVKIAPGADEPLPRIPAADLKAKLLKELAG